MLAREKTKAMIPPSVVYPSRIRNAPRITTSPSSNPTPRKAITYGDSHDGTIGRFRYSTAVATAPAIIETMPAINDSKNPHRAVDLGGRNGIGKPPGGPIGAPIIGPIGAPIGGPIGGAIVGIGPGAGYCG